MIAARLMHELLADRFVQLPHGCVDLASGALVRLRILPALERSSQLAWSDRCAELARLRHPALNPLLDFGVFDRARLFEAYAVTVPLRASAASVSTVLTHAVRFLSARGLQLTSAEARAAIRDVERSRDARAVKPLGVVLQPRTALESLREALDEVSPSGTTVCTVAGPHGSGLRTIGQLAARDARLKGYVPVSSRVLVRWPRLRESLSERHVCLLLEPGESADGRSGVAMCLSLLSTRSARRHVLIRFERSGERRARAMEVHPMSSAALNAMIFRDPDSGPHPADLEAAVRRSSRQPGDFLRHLDGRASVARVALVRESAPAYGREELRPEPMLPGRGISRALWNARDRGVRLAARGRHASAVRVLRRAAAVLEGRHEPRHAAACAEALAWIDRDRGRSDRAVETFERARTLGRDASIAATIGIGVIWTDQRRLIEAEAALRGALAAAEVAGHHALGARAAEALARCLFWLGRHDEAAVMLKAPLAGEEPSSARCLALGRRARIDLAAGDVRAAAAAASMAMRTAESLADLRSIASIARTLAMVQLALGDHGQAGQWIDRGVAAAAAAHLPIPQLRLRALVLRLPSAAASSVNRLRARLRTALAHRPLPPLVRRELDEACREVPHEISIDREESGDNRSLGDLQELLEAMQRASDDTAALELLCARLADRLRAATVQIVADDGRERRLVARAGRPWQGEMGVVDRVLAGATGTPTTASDPYQAASPVRYGCDCVGVLCCRWTAGATVDLQRAGLALRAGALAASSAVRAMLDRVSVPAGSGPCAELIGTSVAAVALREAIVRAARAPFPVLIEGESGSGKELVARAIHRLGPRRDRRLCTLNCAALADELVEAELFGHARGAFTGAVSERAGLFEEADGGTLFLDELGELSPRAQAKLLRVLQDGEVRRVGENLPRRVDARIVGATNRCLADEVSGGRFRADLRFRLDVVRIMVPPLRERAADIPALAAHFWADVSGRVGSSATLTPEALSALARYDWPGNVRELQNAIASLAVHAPRRGRVPSSMLPAHIARAASTSAASFEAARHEFERRYVRAALAQAGGQRGRAARALGVSRQGLAKMMRRLRLDADPGG